MKVAAARDSLKQTLDAEGSLFNPQESYQRERTHSYHLIKYSAG